MTNRATDAPPPRRDLARTVLTILLIAALFTASFWVLQPFLLAIVWAGMIVVATWPALLAVQARLRSRALAVAVMSGAMLLVFVVPLALAVRVLVDHRDTLSQWIHLLATASIPPPPAWLPDLPLIGQKAAELWTEIAAQGKSELATRLAPHATDAAQWLAGTIGSVGMLAVQLLMTFALTVVMFARGEAAGSLLVRFGHRLAGERGVSMMQLASQSIRAVALGVVVTALVQTVLAWTGLMLAGVPFAGLLSGAILLLCVSQIGPMPVLVPAVIWLFWSGATGWAVALAVWTLVIVTMDNVLRPFLIRKGADLPMLLILAGVIGGLLAFGIVGLFIGPVVLAVSYTLLSDWISSPRSTSL